MKWNVSKQKQTKTKELNSTMCMCFIKTWKQYFWILHWFCASVVVCNTATWLQLIASKHADEVKEFGCCSDQTSEWGRQCYLNNWWFRRADSINCGCSRRRLAKAAEDGKSLLGWEGGILICVTCRWLEFDVWEMFSGHTFGPLIPIKRAVNATGCSCWACLSLYGHCLTILLRLLPAG